MTFIIIVITALYYLGLLIVPAQSRTWYAERKFSREGFSMSEAKLVGKS